MALHLTIVEPEIDTPEILARAITDFIADMNEQTITHTESCRFHAYPVPHEGTIVPFGQRKIAVRFVGMAERKPAPSIEAISRIGT